MHRVVPNEACWAILAAITLFEKSEQEKVGGGNSMVSHQVQRFSSAVFVLAFSAAIFARAEDAFQPTWESLRQHNPAPEWFRDAKFGIYFHWGVYCVPAYGDEWYPRNMHDAGGQQGNHVYRHHKQKYGDPAEFGYDEFVPMFKAEKFDAQQWLELFEKSGAKFVGPVAEHHDGFAMWDSSVTPWNSADRGPKRDIMGEITTAARQRGMKVVATFHHARNHLWQTKTDGQTRWTGHYSFAKEHFPHALDDRQRAFLYGDMPREDFLRLWLDKLDEVIAQYSPDLIWFDSWLYEIPEQTRRQFLASYFNHAAATGQEVVVTYKQEDLPQDVGVLDIEKGGMKDLTDFVWLTDDTISLGSWCYTQDLKVKPTKVVLHSLIDIVAKNGQLLLNVSPQADGTIPDNQQQVLIELGQWLDKYGEAIYETRPFTTFGHGPTTAGKGHFGGIALDQAYSARDIRYTRNGNTVYAIQLGWPGSNHTTLLEGFAASEHHSAFDVLDVKLLGINQQIQWESSDNGVNVTTPAEPPDSNPMAIVYRVEVGSVDN